MGVLEIRRLKQLKEQNAKLKQLVAALSPDKTMPQDVRRKRCEASSPRDRVSPASSLSHQQTAGLLRHEVRALFAANKSQRDPQLALRCG
jgi:putative transposase